MMVKFGKKIVKFRVPILILSMLLLIPSAFGYLHTRINYDVLTYLPGDIETMIGQDILVNDFGTGAFSMFIVDGMEDKDVSKLKKKIEEVDHVKQVIWYDSLADISIPKSMLARIIAWPMPPLKRRSMDMQKLHRLSAMPLLDMSAPARMNSGIARYANEFIEAKAVLARAPRLPPVMMRKASEPPRKA